ncbi:helix-turn-helix domain-containing protein [Kitasatospora purpeofusca]|uniref:helix-turn-helix domain-containing protein n=1 Tax=Kitasatospora purpeofusca TaxID=67352 RepID=UPI002255E77E|nr:helix-turn-helix transcriptional regulator [Kitasatospora purpeofusca]MCX4686990.1 helix-turn-helix domain-containing protein [Kitasatospora purpeofusca]
MYASHLSGGEFGPELRRRRLAAGMTLTRLAALLSYSKGHLSKIERGQKAPPTDLARRCDAQLGAGGELERLAPPEGNAGRGAGAGSPAADEDSPLLQVDRDGVRWPGGLGRRRLLAAGATSVLGLGVATTVGAGRAAAAPRSDTSPAEIFRTQLDHMRLLGQSTDPALLLPMLTVQTHTLRELALQAAATDRVRLLGLAARYAEFAGWMAQEAGDEPSALWWTARAVELAEAGDDRDLGPYALVRRALVAFYAGDAATTVGLVGPVADNDRLPPRIRGLAAQREAQGHALAGDHVASLRSLDRARELFTRSAADGGGGGPVIGTSNLTDPAAMVTGWCLYDLGRPAQAAEVLDRECAGLPAHAVRTRARYGLRRALAHAAAGEVEHACALAAELLPLVPALRSATIVTDVARLDRELSRFRAVQAVRDLQPALAAALHPRP